MASEKDLALSTFKTAMNFMGIFRMGNLKVKVSTCGVQGIFTKEDS